MRDAVVVGILLVAAAAARLVWHPLGPWVALGIAFAAALAVVGVYRIRRMRPSRPVVESQQQRELLRQD